VSDFWQHILIAGIVVVVTLVVAKLLDRWLVHRLNLSPNAMTRYSVIRRTVVAAVVIVGVLSALLVIPEVQAVAGSILASSAVIALIIGFAAQSTLSNAIAGILIAFTQPLRLGDQSRSGRRWGPWRRSVSSTRFFAPPTGRATTCRIRAWPPIPFAMRR